MLEIKHERLDYAKMKMKQKHNFYQYGKQEITPRSEFEDVYVCFCRILPGKAAYPFHWHQNSTEVFYIISGTGIVETYKETIKVNSQNVLVFPKGESGAHRLINTSETEDLVYLDVDTIVREETVHYPHSNKIGKIVHNKSAIFYQYGEEVDYYKDE